MGPGPYVGPQKKVPENDAEATRASHKRGQHLITSDTVVSLHPSNHEFAAHLLVHRNSTQLGDRGDNVVARLV